MQSIYLRILRELCGWNSGPCTHPTSTFFSELLHGCKNTCSLINGGWKAAFLGVILLCYRLRTMFFSSSVRNSPSRWAEGRNKGRLLRERGRLSWMKGGRSRDKYLRSEQLKEMTFLKAWVYLRSQEAEGRRDSRRIEAIIKPYRREKIWPC